MRGAAFVLCSLLLGCPSKVKDPTPSERGTSTGAKTTKTLGASGGSFASADGRLTLDIPAGALELDTELGIEPVTNTAPLGVRGAYRLTPDGQTFAKPITVTLTYLQTDLDGSSAEASYVAHQSADGFWRAIASPTVDTSARTVSSSTSHFSDYSQVLGWQLRPGEGHLSPTDQLDLELKFCEVETFEDLAGLIPRCDIEMELANLVTVNGWAVNGKPGGTLGEGIVNGDGVRAKYTAPGDQPLSNPVAVSVDFNRRKGKQIAIANVFVEPDGWRGSVKWSLTGSKMDNPNGYTRTWTVMGSGQLNVVPKLAAPQLPAVGSVSASYSYAYHEEYNHTYDAPANCTHVVHQTRDETLSGMSVDKGAASISIQQVGGMLTVTVGVPGAPATGRLISDGTEMISGTAGNCPMSPPASHTDVANDGTTPSHTLTFAAPFTSGRAMGMTTVHFAGEPPLDYAITYDLAN